jgi:hypothetical protein
VTRLSDTGSILVRRRTPVDMTDWDSPAVHDRTTEGTAVPDTEQIAATAREHIDNRRGSASEFSPEACDETGALVRRS